MLVKPLFGVKRDPKLSRQKASALIVDCTQRPIQRPGDDGPQKDHNSGKKKRRTLETEYLITKGGRIAAVSPSHPDNRHDLTIRRAGPRVRELTRLYGDSTYQDYDKLNATLSPPGPRKFRHPPRTKNLDFFPINPAYPDRFSQTHFRIPYVAQPA